MYAIFLNEKPSMYLLLNNVPILYSIKEIYLKYYNQFESPA